MEIAPGQVETEFSVVRFGGDRERARKVYEGCEPLTPDDVAEIVVWQAGRRENVVVADVLLYPNHQVSFVALLFLPPKTPSAKTQLGWCDKYSSTYLKILNLNYFPCTPPFQTKIHNPNFILLRASGLASPISILAGNVPFMAATLICTVCTICKSIC